MVCQVLIKIFLATLNDPFSSKIVEARELFKARSTFIDSLLKHETNGRIHGEINQLKSDQGGTITGRLSMSNPNLQQIPARNEKIGPMIRSLFIPEEGTKWGSFDYSQQEPRLVVHFAALTHGGLDGADEFVDAYNNTLELQNLRDKSWVAVIFYNATLGVKVRSYCGVYLSLMWV